MRVRIIEKIYHRHGRSLGSNITEVRGLGREAPPNHEANDILSKETHFYCFKTSSYGLYESIYKINLILPLPLSMWELKKKIKMKRLIFVVDFASM
jgi:hypothetical protein